MAFCPYCGAVLTEGARFCSACGAAVTQSAAVQPAVTTLTQPALNGAAVSSSVYSGDGCAVMLVSCGSCTEPAAANLISDLCGYTDAEALQLVRNAPVLIAQALSETQAAYLAQSLAEYGISVSIEDRYGHRTITSGLDSVYDSGGSLLEKVASSLGLIGIANRLTGAIRRLTLKTPPPVYVPPRPARRPPVRRHQIVRPAPVPYTAAPRHRPEPSKTPAKPTRQYRAPEPRPARRDGMRHHAHTAPAGGPARHDQGPAHPDGRRR